MLLTGSLGAAPAPAAGLRELREVALAHFGPEMVEQGRAYQRPRYALFFLETASFLVLAWALALGPPGRWGGAILRAAGGHALLARLLTLAGLAVVLLCLRFPFSLVRYLHARAHGLRHDTLPSFVLDWLKAQGIESAILIGVGFLVLSVFVAWPRVWWLVSWGAVSVLTVLYVYLAPVFIDPVFNRFTPLDNPALTAKVLDVVRRGGVPADEVLVADASRRTRAVNAYFTGFGATRRIVLYDTLLSRFDEPEILSVVAHEVGHWRHHHVNKGLVLGLLAAGAGFLIGHLILGAWMRAGGSSLGGRSDPTLVFLGYALFLTLSLVAQAPENAISRRWESEADRAALELTGDPEGFIRSQVALARENLSDVLPPRWIEIVLFTHPSGARRIRMAEGWK